MSTEAGTSSDSKKMMTFSLEANDGFVITIQEDVAFQSNLLKSMYTDRCEDPNPPTPVLPLANVNGPTLQKIIDWCTQHRGEVYKPKEKHEDPNIKLTKEDEEYLNVPPETLLAILLGANYLEISGLIDIITQKIANMAIEKTVEEIKELYGLTNDFTPEEEEEIRKRFAWVDE